MRRVGMLLRLKCFHEVLCCLLYATFVSMRVRVSAWSMLYAHILKERNLQLPSILLLRITANDTTDVAQHGFKTVIITNTHATSRDLVY